MFLIAIGSLAGAIVLHVKFGGSSFLPDSDAGVVVIDVRTPSSSSLEYSRVKVEGAAALARTVRETKATNAFVNPTGGRVYVDIDKSTQRKRSAADIAAELRTLTARLVGAEYTVLDNLNMGAQKPVKRICTGFCAPMLRFSITVYSAPINRAVSVRSSTAISAAERLRCVLLPMST